jgi:hypothetical protein
VHLDSEVIFAAPTRPAASCKFAPLVLSPTRDASAAAHRTIALAFRLCRRATIALATKRRPAAGACLLVGG